MKIIKYFNKEFVRNEKEKTKQIKEKYDETLNKMIECEEEIEIEKPVFEIKPLTYPVTDKEFQKWYNYIKEAYGKYGDVTYIENGEDTKDREELQAEEIEKLNNELKECKQSIAELTAMASTVAIAKI